MQKNVIVLITSFFLFHISVAQNIDNKIDQILIQFNQLQKIENTNERNYKLYNASKNFITLLTHDNFKYPKVDTLLLKEAVSGDKKFAVYYLLPSILTPNNKVDIFIVKNDIDEKKAFHFQEELNFKTNSKKTIDYSNLKFKFFTKRIGTIDYYELQLTKKNNPIILYRYSDIYLKFLFEDMAITSDLELKKSINKTIQERLNNLLKDKSTFKNQFQGLNRTSTLISPDEKVKLITWNLEKPDATHSFFGYIITKQDDESIKLHHLIDRTDKIRSRERNVLSPKKWYGAIYFDIIQTKYKKTTYYTLLGFKGNDELTKIKLIDAFIILSNGSIRFGSNMFHKNPGYSNRAIYEYSYTTNMMLHYDRDLKMIVMDNLAPSSPMYRNIFQYYGPDFSYNGYKFEKGKWMLQLDLDLRNPKQN